MTDLHRHCEAAGRGSPVRHLQNAGVQIFPLRIDTLNQPNFFGPGPRLKLLFPRNCIHHGRVHFKVNQQVNPIPMGKPGRERVLMLPYALNEIGSHAHIQRAVRLTGQDVNGWLHLFAQSGVPPS